MNAGRVFSMKNKHSLEDTLISNDHPINRVCFENLICLPPSVIHLITCARASYNERGDDVISFCVRPPISSAEIYISRKFLSSGKEEFMLLQPAN